MTDALINFTAFTVKNIVFLRFIGKFPSTFRGERNFCKILQKIGIESSWYFTASNNIKITSINNPALMQDYVVLPGTNKNYDNFLLYHRQVDNKLAEQMLMDVIVALVEFNDILKTNNIKGV